METDRSLLLLFASIIVHLHYVDFLAPIVLIICDGHAVLYDMEERVSWRAKEWKQMDNSQGRPKADHLPGHAMLAFETKTIRGGQRNNNSRNIISFWETIWPTLLWRWPYNLVCWWGGWLGRRAVVLPSPHFSPTRTKILRKKNTKINTSGRPTGAFAPGGFETFRTDAFWQSSDTHNNTHTDAIYTTSIIGIYMVLCYRSGLQFF